MNNEKIDFVILWVDGNDLEWQKEKAKYLPNKNTDSRNIRYRDWENLKYWFRGVEKNAPWVNKIYFVTCGHYPEWLNKDNPKLVCIKHSDYMPKKYLPTFSANPIELNLYKIKGLSEQFVYFNDDIFVVNSVKPTDFFKKGKPCDMAVFNPISGRDETFICLEQNVNLILNRYFDFKTILKKNVTKYLNIRYGMHNFRTLFCLPFRRIQGFYEQHSCNSFLKSTFKEVWDKEFKTLDETSKRKFRSRQDVNQYIFKYWQFCKGNFVPKKHKRKSIRIFDDLNNTYKILKQKKYKIICLNDSESTDDEFEIAKKKIINIFEKLLPEKSSFEK